MSKTKPGRLTAALLDTADDMRRVGVLSARAHQKITLRHSGDKDILPEPMTPEEIGLVRQKSHLIQAVFAHYLNVAAGYVSQLERGAKKPAGPAVVLLDMIRRKGIEVIL